MEALPKVLLMGLRKSGKSSIQQVVFQGMQPHNTVTLPTTVVPGKTTMDSNEFLNFEVWDFPGQNDPFDENNANRYDANQLLENCGVIVFVLDCREQVDVARVRLVDTICAAYRYDPRLCVEVFIHKVDALSEDHQTDLLTFLQRKVEEEVRQRVDNPGMLSLSFNLTSIYDHSVFQAFSLVVQQLIKSKLPKVSQLLQMVNSNCGSDVSYLFLTHSKIFLAVDESKRLKLRSYDLCSDAIDVVMKMEAAYETVIPANAGAETPGNAASPTKTANSPLPNDAENSSACAALVKKPNDRAVVHLSNSMCIYVRKLPSALTMVLMLKQSDLCHKVLIDRNIDTCYNAVYKIFCAKS